MESKKEPKPEVIFIKTSKLTADNKNGSVIIKTEKVRADYKQDKCAKIEVADKKKAVIIKMEKPGASTKENVIPSAAVKNKKRKAAPASNNKTHVLKKARKMTECCHQLTCKYHYQVLATKEAMVEQYGYTAMETYHAKEAQSPTLRLLQHCRNPKIQWP
jgi:hypothetical protein